MKKITILKHCWSLLYSHPFFLGKLQLSTKKMMYACIVCMYICMLVGMYVCNHIDQWRWVCLLAKVRVFFLLSVSNKHILSS